MSGYYSNEHPSLSEKIISACSYLTLGIVGFVWLIIVSLQKAYVKPFLKYHILQSIFLAIIMTVFSIIVQAVLHASRVIPGVRDLVDIVLSLLLGPMLMGFSIVNIILALVVLYLTVTCVMGKYSYIPWFSDNIRQML